MTAIWAEATRRWGDRVTLQARKALAHDGAYDKPAATAEADVHTFVRHPLANGAKAVDVWTWSQPYRGTTPSADRSGIGRQRARHCVARSPGAWREPLDAHGTPSSLQKGWRPRLRAATSIFGTVFVTSGDWLSGDGRLAVGACQRGCATRRKANRRAANDAAPVGGPLGQRPQRPWVRVVAQFRLVAGHGVKLRWRVAPTSRTTLAGKPIP